MRAWLRKIKLFGRTPGGWWMAVRLLWRQRFGKRRPVRQLQCEGKSFSAIPYKGFEILFHPPATIIDEIQFETDEYEPDVLARMGWDIRSRKAELVLDVGANIGLISLSLLSSFRTLKIVAFEPGPHQANCLAHSIRQNELGSRLTLINSAVGNQNTTLEFCVHAPEHASGDGFFDTGRAGPGQRITVPCTTLDEWWSKAGRPAVGLIKIDVEGAEHWVLEGARELIATCKPVIYYEVCQENLGGYPHKSADTVRLLNQLGYSVYDVNDALVIERDGEAALSRSGVYAARPMIS